MRYCMHNARQLPAPSGQQLLTLLGLYTGKEAKNLPLYQVKNYQNVQSLERRCLWLSWQPGVSSHQERHLRKAEYLVEEAHEWRLVNGF